MAEKYGVVPKRFTKAWWEYFWEYYKWHTIVILTLAAVFAVCVYQAVTKPEYYFTVSYAGEFYLSDEQEARLSEKLSSFVNDEEDCDGIALNQVAFVEENEDPQALYTKITRLQLEVTNEETMIYIFDADKAKYYIESESMDGAFLTAEEWLNTEIDDDRLIGKDGKTYAVRLDDSGFLKECEIDGKDLYIAMRNHTPEEAEKLKEKISDAKSIANTILE